MLKHLASNERLRGTGPRATVIENGPFYPTLAGDRPPRYET